MTLVQLGEAAGLHPGYLSRVERDDRRRASEQASARLAEALQIDPRYLTGQLPPYRALRRLLISESATRFADWINMDPDRLEDLELGRESPTDSEINAIARRLGVPREVLMLPDDKMSSDRP